MSAASLASTPSTTPQPTSRPRLVAKTTSSLRDSSRPAGAGAGGGGGPDPNQVWNKNRRAFISALVVELY